MFDGTINLAQTAIGVGSHEIDQFQHRRPTANINVTATTKPV